MSAQDEDDGDLDDILITYEPKIIARLSCIPEQELADLLSVVEAAREYTTERTYQNVEACRKDQDRLEGLLLAAIHRYDANRQKAAALMRNMPWITNA